MRARSLTAALLAAAALTGCGSGHPSAALQAHPPTHQPSVLVRTARVGGLSFAYPVTWSLTTQRTCDGGTVDRLQAPSAEVNQALGEIHGRISVRYAVTISTYGHLACLEFRLRRDNTGTSLERNGALDAGLLKGGSILLHHTAGHPWLTEAVTIGGTEPAVVDDGQVLIDSTPYTAAAQFFDGSVASGVSTPAFTQSELYSDTIWILQSLS